MASPCSDGTRSDWRKNCGWRGGNRLASFLQRLARADAAHSWPEQSARAKRAAAARCGRFARRRTRADEIRYTFTAVRVSDHMNYPQPRFAVTALRAPCQIRKAVLECRAQGPSKCAHTARSKALRHLSAYTRLAAVTQLLQAHLVATFLFIRQFGRVQIQ